MPSDAGHFRRVKIHRETAAISTSRDAAGDAAPVSRAHGLCGGWYTAALFVDPGQENEKLI